VSYVGFLVSLLLSSHSPAYQACDAHEARAQQTKSARFWDHDVAVSTGDYRGAVKETLAGIDRQLDGCTTHTPATDCAVQCVRVHTICQVDPRPSHGAAERAVENHAVRAADLEAAACCKSGATGQRAASQRSGREVHTTQIGSGNESAPV